MGMAHCNSLAKTHSASASKRNYKENTVIDRSKCGVAKEPGHTQPRICKTTHVECTAGSAE